MCDIVADQLGLLGDLLLFEVDGYSGSNEQHIYEEEKGHDDVDCDFEFRVQCLFVDCGEDEDKEQIVDEDHQGQEEEGEIPDQQQI